MTPSPDILGLFPVEEEELSSKTDLAFAMLDGCGPGCEIAEPLSHINAELAAAGKTAKILSAICVSEKLREQNSSQ